jgi:hypothetical protein
VIFMGKSHGISGFPLFPNKPIHWNEYSGLYVSNIIYIYIILCYAFSWWHAMEKMKCITVYRWLHDHLWPILDLDTINYRGVNIVSTSIPSGKPRCKATPSTQWNYTKRMCRQSRGN